MTQPTRGFDVSERPEAPWLSIVLNYGPMIPFVVGAILAWVTRGAIRAEIVLLTLLYTSSILLFLAGLGRPAVYAGGHDVRARRPRYARADCLWGTVSRSQPTGGCSPASPSCSCSIQSRHANARHSCSSLDSGRRRSRSPASLSGDCSLASWSAEVGRASFGGQSWAPCRTRRIRIAPFPNHTRR